MSMDEMYTGVTRGPTPTATLDEMIAATEQLLKDLPACWHYDLIACPFLNDGDRVVYACIQCLKKFSAPISLFDGKPPMKLRIDPFMGLSFGMEASE